MKHRRHVLDGNAVTLVEVGNSHQNYPLRPANSQNPSPKLAYFVEMNVHCGDVPEKSPDDLFVVAAPAGEPGVMTATSRSGSGCDAGFLGHDETSIMNGSRRDSYKKRL